MSKILEEQLFKDAAKEFREAEKIVQKSKIVLAKIKQIKTKQQELGKKLTIHIELLEKMKYLLETDQSPKTLALNFPTLLKETLPSDEHKYLSPTIDNSQFQEEVKEVIGTANTMDGNN